MQNPIQIELKNEFMKQARNFDLEKLKSQEDRNDTVTLFHGTNTFHLNSILENGILPRNKTGNNNWDKEEAYSNEDIVYLTNKWHYWYAYNSTERLLERKYGKDWSSVKEAQWWLTGSIFPIYLECEIPKVYLTLDEDIVFSKFVKDEIKRAIKKGTDLQLNVTWEDSLAHQGTVGVRGGIPREFIKSIHILGDPHLYLELMDNKRQHMRDYDKWIQGKGKGKLKLKDLQEIEQKYQYIGSVPLNVIPKGYKLSQCYYDRNQQSMSFVANTPEEYELQPRQLEKI
ncbi:hypothetical protein CON36_35425 [Bacillus cereus]|uniref:Uncharacterized protein n=3 Tax=Bacillus cereus group TaxID=86661 RepID=A0A9X6WFC6_BACTU|nr:hypothetical protein [Bacillus thuringiensis]PDZ94135.1 hypothetical protein CON36_35425 [Bacillus cereus]PFJ25591.1 hypothetical protein COJ15_35625 [Bacillus thuringiensis]